MGDSCRMSRCKLSYAMIQDNMWVACTTILGACDVEESSRAHLQLFPLPLSDYILGICDLTGELMRLAISSISKPNGRMKASQISLFVRGCKSGKTRSTAQVARPRKPNFDRL